MAHMGKRTDEFFTLGALWNCYEEWSVYGAGAPIALDNGETLVQYYVPYLFGSIGVKIASVVEQWVAYKTNSWSSKL